MHHNISSSTRPPSLFHLLSIISFIDHLSLCLFNSFLALILLLEKSDPWSLLYQKTSADDMALLASARSGHSQCLILLSTYCKKKALLRTNMPKSESSSLADVIQHLIGLHLIALYGTTIHQLPGNTFSNKIALMYPPVG